MNKADIIKRANKNTQAAKASGVSGTRLNNPDPYPSSSPAQNPKTKKKPGRKV